MSPRRVIDWQIKPGDENDTYDLLLRHKTVLTGRSLTDIHKHLRKHRQPNQSIHQVADDGYITDVTTSVDRRQKHRPVRPARPRRGHRPVRMPLLRF